jgi:hypothetical protein
VKPREFWIIKEKGFSTWVSDEPLHSADTTDEIHVREVLPGTVTISREEFRELATKARQTVLKDGHPELMDLEIETLLFGSCLSPEEKL